MALESKANIISFSILDILFLVYTSVVMIFYLTTLPDNPYGIYPAILYLGLICLVFVVRYFRKKKKVRWLSIAYPLIYLIGVFQSFFMVIPWFNNKRYDELLSSIDFDLLGVNPTVWIEQFHHPILTEVLYFLYFLYFPLQFFIIIYLYKKKRYKSMESAVLILLITNFGAYLSYFFFPAMGPRYFLADLQTVSLDGIFISKPIMNTINMLEPNKLDVFPSLHSAVLIVSLLLMNKYNKKMMYILLVPGVGIMISLVYCRYHYVIDMIVGVAWAMLCYIGGTAIYDRYSPKLTDTFWEK